MATWSPLTTNWAVNLDDCDPRDREPDTIQNHHTATSSKIEALAAFAPGGRTVTPNYFVAGKEVWGIVPEEYRAYTSGSFRDDARAITIETLNASNSPHWGFDQDTLDTLARLNAEIAARRGIPLVHASPGVIEHRNIYEWWGRSYPTACAGPSFNIAEHIARTAVAALPAEPEPEDDMTKPLLAMKLDGGPMNTLGVMIEPDGTVVGLDKGQWEFWRDRAKITPIECKNPGHWEYLMGVMAKRRERAGVTLSEADLQRLTDAVRDAVDGGQVTAAEVAAQLQITVKA